MFVHIWNVVRCGSPFVLFVVLSPPASCPLFRVTSWRGAWDPSPALPYRQVLWVVSFALLLGAFSEIPTVACGLGLDSSILEAGTESGDVSVMWKHIWKGQSALLT